MSHSHGGKKELLGAVPRVCFLHILLGLRVTSGTERAQRGRPFYAWYEVGTNKTTEQQICDELQTSCMNVWDRNKEARHCHL